MKNQTNLYNDSSAPIVGAEEFALFPALFEYTIQTRQRHLSYFSGQKYINSEVFVLIKTEVHKPTYRWLQKIFRLSRKKVWMPRFALNLGDSLLIYRIDCSFNFFEIASAHFVGKFTHTHILAIFNLVQLSYILSIVLLYVLSVRQKVPKNWAVVYGILCFLCL